MRALSYRPFCSCGSRRVSLWYLSAGLRYTTRDPPEPELAAAHYQQTLVLAEEIGMRPLQAHCHRGLGMLYAMTGQREQARVQLSTAVDLYQAMAMNFWLPETEAALAQVKEG
jgi:hypothetical protein